uniref:Myotubularin related protein 11 n=1 Tax=Amphiprion percula TaxID=161767 RepID=A0A3P8U9L5_AMPPE
EKTGTTTWKLRIMEHYERMLSQTGVNARNRDVLGLRCLPGECVLQRAVMVRKKLTAREGRGWLSGTLFCTHFRVAFVPQDSPKPDDNADPVLLGDHDVALAAIEKVVVVGPNRTKLVTPSSSLKFTPEELVLYCRDMRVICFLFDRLTPDTQVIEITYTIAKAAKSGSVLSFQNAALGSSLPSWCGATSWRVSSVNDRFEMSTSLPRFIVVPQKVLDTELKKSFAHFNEGRIPRWCWRHPRGNDIRNLEMVLFGCQSSLCVVVELGEELPLPADIQLAHSRLRALCLGDISTSVSVPDDKWLSTLETTHWLDYTRSCLRKASEVACLLRGGHLTVALQEAEDRDMSCVVSSLVQVMCDPHCRTQHGFQGLVQKEWVMAGHRFCSRINYRHDNDKEEAPVFQLFLDCLTDEFLLALHDSIQLPLFSSFLANSQRERCKRSQNLGQTYTPVNGWRDVLHPESSDPSDPPLPPVWDWSLQYSKSTQDRFTQPVAPTPPLQPLLNGNLNTNPDTHRLADTIPGSVFLLSRGTFSCPANLLPWRSGSSGVYKKSHRRALSSENVPGLERLLKAWALTDFPQALTSTSGPQGPLDPYEPLLPLLMGPCMGLWRECYLRGALHAQAFSHPISANHLHPVERLAQEVQQLKDKLAEVSSSTDLTTPTGTSEPRRTDTNLNQNTNNGTFLFPSSRPQGSGVQRPAPPPTSTNHQTSRGPPPASAPPSRSAHKDTGSSNKHTFLFGHSSGTEVRPEQRYYPAPNNAKLPKSNGPSLAS